MKQVFFFILESPYYGGTIVRKGNYKSPSQMAVLFCSPREAKAVMDLVFNICCCF